MSPVEDATIIWYPLAPTTKSHVSTTVVPFLASAVTDDGGGSAVMAGEGEGTRDGDDDREEICVGTGEGL